MQEEQMELEYDNILKETISAVLLVIEGDEYWMPKSQIILDKKDQTIELPIWLAKQKGIY